MNAKQYKIYPKYKDSGIEWLGRVPQEWEKYRIKSIIQKHFNGVWGNEEKGDNNDVICIRVADFDRDGLSVSLDNTTIRNISNTDLNNKLLQKNDLLIEKSGGGEKTLVGAVVKLDTNKKCVCSNFVSCIRLKSNAYSQYINYYFNSLYSQRINYLAIKQTTGIQNIDTEYYFNSKVFLPPLFEQEKIARFLDAKVGHIDRLVSKLEEQLELIDEQRNSLITEIVCKGLNPKAPLKNSGIEWLGKIPTHWLVKRLKYVVSINPDVLSEKTDENYEIEYIDIGGVSLLKGIENIQAFLFKEAPSRARRKVKVGDTIVSTVRTYLKAIAYIDKANKNTIVSTGFAVVRPNPVLNNRYLGYIMINHIFINSVMAYSNGVSYPAINAPDIGLFSIAIPPLSEQQEIVTYLDEKLTKIDALKSKTIKQIELLKEYKTSLITNVVTGKIDVRNEVI